MNAWHEESGEEIVMKLFLDLFALLGTSEKLKKTP
jgi:hypothetical protein